MPAIPFAKDGQLTDGDEAVVLAVMAHPADTPARDQFLARIQEMVFAYVEEHLKDEFGESEVLEQGMLYLGALFGASIAPHGGFGTLAEAPSASEAVSGVSGSAWAGAIAGDLLLNILQLESSGQGGSVNKAVFLMKDYLSRARDDAGESHGGSERYIRKSWMEYRTVSHLWAAYRIWFFHGAEDEGDAEPDFTSPLCPVTIDGLPGFLALAEELLKAAAEHRPRGRKESTLDLAAAWRPPEGLELPPAWFTSPPLEAHKVEVLRRYKAPSPL